MHERAMVTTGDPSASNASPSRPGSRRVAPSQHSTAPAVAPRTTRAATTSERNGSMQPARTGGELVQPAAHDQRGRLLAAGEQRQVSDVALPAIEQGDAQGLVEAGGDEALGPRRQVSGRGGQGGRAQRRGGGGGGRGR